MAGVHSMFATPAARSPAGFILACRRRWLVERHNYFRRRARATPARQITSCYGRTDRDRSASAGIADGGQHALHLALATFADAKR